MRHGNPKDEVGDIPGPEAGAIGAPDTDAGADHVEDAGSTDRGESSGEGDCRIPPERSLSLDDRTDRVGHPERVAIVENLRRTLHEMKIGRVQLGRLLGGRDIRRGGHTSLLGMFYLFGATIGGTDEVGTWHRGVRIADPRHVGDARARVEIGER